MSQRTVPRKDSASTGLSKYKRNRSTKIPVIKESLRKNLTSLGALLESIDFNSSLRSTQRSKLSD